MPSFENEAPPIIAVWIQTCWSSFSLGSFGLWDSGKGTNGQWPSRLGVFREDGHLTWASLSGGSYV